MRQFCVSPVFIPKDFLAAIKEINHENCMIRRNVVYL